MVKNYTKSGISRMLDNIREEADQWICQRTHSSLTALANYQDVPGCGDNCYSAFSKSRQLAAQLSSIAIIFLNTVFNHSGIDGWKINRKICAEL